MMPASLLMLLSPKAALPSCASCEKRSMILLCCMVPGVCCAQAEESKRCSAGGFTVPVGQDVMISVYNIHHSPAVWEDPEAFRPERFPLDEPVPNEANTDYRHAAERPAHPASQPCLPAHLS